MEKIKRLIKNLKKFQLDDIMIFSEEDESIVKQQLEQLLNEKFIIKDNNGDFIYIPTVENKQEEGISLVKLNVNKNFLRSITNLNDVASIKPEDIFYDQEELNCFKYSAPYLKRRLLKIFVLFVLTEKLSINETYYYVLKLQKEKSDFACHAHWLNALKRKYRQGGIHALYPKLLVAQIDETLYNDFKTLYLTRGLKSFDTIYRQLKNAYPDIHPFPALSAFKSKLNDDIKKQPNTDTDINIVGTSIDSEVAKWQLLTLRQAIETYSGENNLLPNERFLINKYILPYFKNYCIKDITKEHFAQFKRHLKVSISKYQAAKIVKIFRKIVFYKDENLTTIAKNRLLEPYTINEVYNISKKSLYEFWLIVFGLKIEEINAITYADIDYENKILNINKSVKSGKYFYYKYSMLRSLIIPDYILQNITIKKAGLIFENPPVLDEFEYKRLMLTHIHLAATHNIPSHLIGKRMGYSSPYSFYQEYSWALPQDMEEDFDILAGIKEFQVA